MYTRITTKFAALAIALLINGLMFSSVAYLFNGKLHGAATATLVEAAVSRSALGKI